MMSSDDDVERSSRGFSENFRKSMGVTRQSDDADADVKTPMMGGGGWKALTKDMCGLRSPDPQIRKKAQIRMCMSTSFCTVILVVLIIFVFVPMYVRDLVENSDLNVIESTIINPNDVSFRSEVKQKFKNTGDLAFTAKVKMRDLELTWRRPDTGEKAHLVTLTDSNTITLRNENEVTLKSTAKVVDIEALTLFNIYALALESFEWGADGSADINGGTGDIRVDIDKKMEIKGFNHFPIDTAIQTIEITSGTPTYLLSNIIATFYSPATLGIDFQQDVNFAVKSNGIDIGMGTMPDMYLKTGEFDVAADVVMTSSNDAEYYQLMQVVSNFTMGLDSPITMGPFATTTTIQWLAPGLALISMPTFIPGLDEPLIAQVDMYPHPSTPEYIPFTMNLNNPIDTDISLTYLKADIYTSGVQIAFVDAFVDVVIPARGTVTTALINATVIIFPGSSSELLIDVDSLLTGAIGEFPVSFNYSQVGITAYIHAEE